MYTPKTWTDGEILEASEMNNIETGIYNNNVAIPTQATESAGVITFKNESGNTVFTVALPLYDGGVS